MWSLYHSASSSSLDDIIRDLLAQRVWKKYFSMYISMKVQKTQTTYR